jgi:hypothetical protein
MATFQAHAAGIVMLALQLLGPMALDLQRALAG